MATNQCPECGAAYQDDLTCESVFNEFLALEFTGAEYGAVHMLTVACFMIQHGRYSDEGLVWIKQRLHEALEKAIPQEQIRRQAATEIGQDRRSWKVTRRPGDPPQAKIPWSMSILDVAAQYRDAESYRRLVRQWAATTLAEMQPLLRK